MVLNCEYVEQFKDGANEGKRVGPSTGAHYNRWASRNFSAENIRDLVRAVG